MKRVAFIASAAIVGVGMVSTANASDNGWYAWGGVGINFLDDVEQTISTTASSVTVEFDNDHGLAFGLAVGYHLTNRWRIEGEISYRSNDIDNATFAGVTVPTTTDPEYKSFSFMANALYDFDTGSQWQPYIGAGAGFARVEIEDLTTSLFSDEDLVPAGQLIAGLNYQFTDKWSLGVRYNFLYQDGGDFEGLYGVLPAATVEDEDYLHHTIRAVFTYEFN